jgi:hypothetical protein
MPRLPFALLAGVLTLAAAEFWDSKPYQKWTDQEIARVLVDSPWAKEVFIRFEGDIEERLRAQSQTPPPAPASPSQVGRNGSSANGGGPIGSMVGRKRDPLPPGATVSVRWESAKPLRQAIAATKKAALAPQPPHYELVIDRIPPYMEQREPANLRDILLQISELTWDREAPVRPLDASVSANADGLIVRLKFPRREEPPVAGSTAELHTRIGVSRVKCSFKVKAMTVAGRPEL